jgi:hypothetical protein
MFLFFSRNILILIFIQLSLPVIYTYSQVKIKTDTVKTKVDTSFIKKSSLRGKDTLTIRKDTLLLADTSKNNIFVFPKHYNAAFDVGEKLIFGVGYGFITAGRAVMEIPKYEYFKGRKAFRVEFKVNTFPFFSTFYKVEDRYVSLIDCDGLFPWHFEQRIREGGYEDDFKAEFDHENKTAITAKDTFPIEPFVHDILSALYYTRIIDYSEMRGGHIIELKNFYKDTTYNLNIRFRGREKIKVDAGTFQCVIVEPIVEAGGLFKSEGVIYVWLTDDDKKIPVKVESKILIGSISAELVEYSGIKGKIEAKVK